MNIPSFLQSKLNRFNNFRLAQMFLFIWFIILGYGGIDGKQISREEDLELDRQLKILNKPAITTIQTIYGDTYNCLDFYEQPAFDHPSLKHRKFQFQMTHSNKENNQRNSSRNCFKPEKFWSNKKGCPSGTVPIRNVTKDDLIQAKLVEKIYSSKLSSQDPYIRYAVAQAIPDLPNKYYGGHMRSNVYGLGAGIGNDQYTSTQMKIQNGPDTIIVGTTANPMIYSDKKTHLFMYTTTKSAQCFNTLCPNPLFVLANKEIPLDYVFPVTSQRGVPTKIVTFSHYIYKDPSNGNYYLVFNDNIEVGWWPQSVFTSLADSAIIVEWGGEVFSPPGRHPPMGSGYGELVYETSSDGFCSNLKVVDETYKLVNPNELYLKIDKPYNGRYFENVGEYENIFYFGGDGEEHSVKTYN